MTHPITRTADLRTEAELVLNAMRTALPRTTVRIVRRHSLVSTSLLTLVKDHDGDLARQSNRESLLESIRRTAAALGQAIDVAVCPTYWHVRQDRTPEAEAFARTYSPKRFYEELRPGQRLRRTDDGETLVVNSVGRTRFSTGAARNRINWRMPSASEIRCDGRIVRISLATQNAPDAHAVFEWLR